MLLAVCMVALGAFTGCSDPDLETVDSTFTVTLTATSGSLSHSTTFKLTVK
jgi:hypothetical protein